MTAGLDQIERDLESLQRAGAAIAQKATRLYEDYLQALGRSARQQLILASYHVCTQVYPENFLQLSLIQRQQLQQDIQHLAQQVATAIQKQMSYFELSEPETLEAIAQLIQAQEQLEIEIAEALHTASRQVNQILQTAGILPPTPLEMILDVAAKAEAAGRPVTRSPNLLTAMVETEDNDSEAESQEATVIAVYLQLGEIEFTDATVMLHRNQLRDLSTQITRLHQQIQKKQRQRLVVEAGAAWRATWHEEA